RRQSCYRPGLPDLAENLSADTLAARLPASHHAARRGEDVDAQATLDAADLVAAHIHTASGTRDALQVADRSFIVRAILQVHAQHLAAVFFGSLVVGDIALFLQNAGDLGLQLRGGNVQLLVARADRVADAGQKICDWIGKAHALSFILRSLWPVYRSGPENQRRWCGWPCSARPACLKYVTRLCLPGR